MAFYGAGITYGSGTVYAPGRTGGTDTLQSLDFYRTDVDDTYVFHWTFLPEFVVEVGPIIPTFDYELETDSVDTFNSGDLQTFTSATAINFQDGNIFKGFSVPVFDRIESAKKTFFARVRIKDGTVFRPFSATLTVRTIEDVVRETADRIIGDLPDFHVYPKDEVVKALNNRSTNIAKVYQGYGAEFDRSFLEKELALRDARLQRCRDERLFDIFGDRFGFPKPSAVEFVDYRAILTCMRDGNFDGSTIQAIKNLGRCFTGLNATIIPFGQLLNFITAGKITEAATIPGSGPFEVTLGAPPRNIPVIPGFTFTLSTPGSGEFSVDFGTGVLTFDASDASTAITIVYVSAATIHSILITKTTTVTSVPAGSPFTVTLSPGPIDIPIIPGFTFENTTTPSGAGKFTVDFATGILTFDAADASAAISVTYTPNTPSSPVIFNRLEAGTAIRIVLTNPIGLTLDLDLIAFLMEQLVPAHVRFVLTVAA